MIDDSNFTLICFNERKNTIKNSGTRLIYNYAKKKEQLETIITIS